MRVQGAKRSVAARVSSRILLGVAASLLAQSMTRAQPPARDEHATWSSSFSALSREIFARLDEAERTALARGDQALVIERARGAFDEATKKHEIAQITLEEYLKGIYPQDLQSAESGIRMAETHLTRLNDHLRLVEEELKKDPNSLYARRQQLVLKASLEDGEIGLKNAKRKLLTLQEYTKARQTAELDAGVYRAKADARAKEEEVVQETGKRESVKRQAARAALLDEETKAIALLDEAIQVEARWRAALEGAKDGEGKDSLAESAKAKLGEAVKAWDEARAKRAELVEADAKERIRRAAEATRGRGPDRP